MTISGGFSSTGDKRPVSLQFTLFPTEIERVARLPGASVKMVAENGRRCLEIRDREASLLWDLEAHQLVQHAYSLDDRHTMVVRPGISAWQEIETKLQRGLTAENSKPGGFTDWAQLLLMSPDLAKATQGIITPESIKSGALLLDMGAEFMGPVLEKLNAAPPVNKFDIPMNAERLEANHSTVMLMAEVWFMFTDLLPNDTWIWELAREVFYAQAGRTEHTQAVLDRIAKSPDLGPLGCLLAEALLRKMGLPQAMNFRQLAAQKLNVASFEKDWKLLFQSSSGLSNAADGLLGKLRALDDHQINLLAGLIDDKILQQPLHDAVVKMRATSGSVHEDMLWPLARKWWIEQGEARLRAAIEQTPGSKPANPAIVAARVNGIEITREEVNATTKFQEQELRTTFANKPDELNKQLSVMKITALETHIDKVLILQAFQKSGGFVKPEIVDENVNSLVRESFRGDRANFLKELELNGLTLERFKALRKDMMIVQFMRSKIAGSVKEPTEEELKAAYDKLAASGAREINLNAITLPKTDGKSSPEIQRKLAESIRAEASKGRECEDRSAPAPNAFQIFDARGFGRIHGITFCAGLDATIAPRDQKNVGVVHAPLPALVCLQLVRACSQFPRIWTDNCNNLIEKRVCHHAIL